MQTLDNKQLDRILLEIGEHDFEQLLEKIPEDMDDVRELLTMRRALLKLFSDRDYYETVKNAVQDLVVDEIFGGEHHE